MTRFLNGLAWAIYGIAVVAIVVTIGGTIVTVSILLFQAINRLMGMFWAVAFFGAVAFLIAFAWAKERLFGE